LKILILKIHIDLTTFVIGCSKSNSYIAMQCVHGMVLVITTSS